MDYALSDEQRALRNAVRQFAAERLAPHYQEDDRKGTLRAELRTQLTEMGLLGLRIPVEYGGQGADCATTGIALEEIARADFNAAYLALNAALVGEILLAAGDEKRRGRWLSDIADGTAVPCLMLTEPDHGSDAANLQMRATRTDNGWRLNGEKTSITLGSYADTGLVFARTGPEGARGISAFYIDLDERYVTRSAFSDLGNRSIGRASLFVEDLVVEDDRMIGAEGAGFVEVMKGFDYSRALIGLMCLGTAQAAIDDALAYAGERHAFGQPIGRFQGLTFPLVEYATYLRAARHLCYEALTRKDSGLPHTVEANMAKWWAPKIAVEAAHQSLLTFGHAGFSDELPQGQRMRDIIGLEIGDGTAQIAKLVVARQLLGKAAAP